MLFLGLRRAVMTVAAVILTVTGLLGAYSYGKDYYQHRGFVTVARLPRAGKGRLLNVHFYSRALQRQAFYLVYLPPGYQRSHHYPVFYMLHGMPGRPQVYIDIANVDVRLDNQLSEGHLRPMILVFPDGRIGGSTYSDSEWANTASGHFENYVLNVVGDVDHRFSTLPERQDRVIAGFSAGGYGAINIALHHLSVFGNVEVWSGYFTETRSGVFAHASRPDLEYNSPIDYVRRLRRTLAFDPLRVFMFVGRDDDSSLQIVPMADALNRAGAAVTYAIYSGGHDWGVWYPRLNQMLILASHDVTHPLRPRKSKPNEARGIGAVAVSAGLRRRGARRAVALRRSHRLLALRRSRHLTAVRRDHRLVPAPRDHRFVLAFRGHPLVAVWRGHRLVAVWLHHRLVAIRSGSRLVAAQLGHRRLPASRRARPAPAAPAVPAVPVAQQPTTASSPVPIVPALLFGLAVAALIALGIVLRRRGLAGVLLLPVCLLAGIGLLYVLRGIGWFALGPHISDSLPLLQLAGFDGQPIARVAAAWLPIGVVFGLALPRVRPLVLAAGSAVAGALLLIAASNASYALADNLRLTAVLWHRLPPPGPWLEALLFAAGAALPQLVRRLRSRRADGLLPGKLAVRGRTAKRTLEKAAA